MFPFSQMCLKTFQARIARVIEEFIESGGTKEEMIESLKPVSCVCSYQKTPTHPPMLVEILQPYFTPWKRRLVLLNLLDNLIKVFPLHDCFSRYHFVNTCILPYFPLYGKAETVKFYKELLTIILNDALNSGHYNWLEQIPILPLILDLTTELNFAIAYQNFALKEDLVELLLSLHALRVKFEIFQMLKTKEVYEKLECHLKSLHPSIRFYILDFMETLDIDVTELPLDQLFSYCVIRKKRLTLNNIYLKNTKYFTLVIAVSEVLFFFSFVEIRRLISLLRHFKVTPKRKRNINKIFIAQHENRIINCIRLLSIGLCKLKKMSSISVKKWSSIIRNFFAIIKIHTNDICANISAFYSIVSEIIQLAKVLKSHTDLICPALFRLIKAFNIASLNNSTKKVLKKEIVPLIKTLPRSRYKILMLEYIK